MKDIFGLFYSYLSTTALSYSLRTIRVTPRALILIIDARTSKLIATSGALSTAINATTSSQLYVRDSPHEIAAAVGRYFDGMVGGDGYLGLWERAVREGGGVGYLSALQTFGNVYVDWVALQSRFRGLNWLVVVGTPEDDFLALVKKMNWAFVIATIIFSFAAAAIAIWSGLFLAKPLDTLRKLMLKVQRMELSNSALKSSSGASAGAGGAGGGAGEGRKVVGDPSVHGASSIAEIRGLQDGFYKMTKGLKSFEKFVPSKRIVQTIMEDEGEAELSVSRRIVTIFFSDIANFTNFSETMPPKELIFLLSDYLTEMSLIIQSHEGTVGEFIGDAIMAYWNSPNDVPDHATQACLAALTQLHRLAILRNSWAMRGWPDVRIRIGINTGSVLHGIIGSATRLKWGLVGDNVNLTSRLESLCKYYSCQILLSGTVKPQLLDPNHVHDPTIPKSPFITRDVDIVTVKGKQNATCIVELMGHIDEPDAAMLREKAKKWSSIFEEFYLRRRWDECRRKLEEFLCAYDNDGYVKMLGVPFMTFFR